MLTALAMSAGDETSAPPWNRRGSHTGTGSPTEHGFYVRYAGKRVHVDVGREHLEDYPASDPTDQKVIRKQIRGNLEAALA